jgi:hypothetical protein
VQLKKDGNDIHTNYVDQASSLQKILENAKISFRNCIFRCKDSTGHHILLKFDEAQLKSTDGDWKDESMTENVGSSRIVYKLLTLHDLFIEVEENNQRRYVLNDANLSCKMKKKIKSVLHGSISSDFFGEEYKLLWDVKASKPQFEISGLLMTLVWDKNRSDYEIVVEEGGLLHMDCPINPHDISIFSTWYSNFSDSILSANEAKLKHKVENLQITSVDLEHNLRAQKQLVHELNDRLLKSAQSTDARKIDERLGEVISQIESLKEKYASGMDKEPSVSRPDIFRNELSSIQEILNDVMCSKLDSTKDTKTWKETSGRVAGSEGYRFGDLSRSALNAFFS